MVGTGFGDKSSLDTILSDIPCWVYGLHRIAPLIVSPVQGRPLSALRAAAMHLEAGPVRPSFLGSGCKMMPWKQCFQLLLLLSLYMGVMCEDSSDITNNQPPTMKFNVASNIPSLDEQIIPPAEFQDREFSGAREKEASPRPSFAEIVWAQPHSPRSPLALT